MKFDIIYLDMDGVLADFATAAAAVCCCPDKGTFGLYPPATHTAGEHWGFEDPDLFWKLIDDGVDRFWVDLDPLPWFTQIVRLSRQWADNVVILTAPARSPYSALGKMKWLHKRFGVTFTDFIMCPAANKAQLAAPGRLLIDDYTLNVEQFVEAGGASILFPAPWNDAIRPAGTSFGGIAINEVVTYVTECLESFDA